MDTIENCTTLVDGYNYCVYYPFQDGLFIMHIQGETKRKIYELSKEVHKGKLPVYFCAKDKDMWKNHSKLVGHFANGLEVYQYVAK